MLAWGNCSSSRRNSSATLVLATFLLFTWPRTIIININKRCRSLSVALILFLHCRNRHSVINWSSRRNATRISINSKREGTEFLMIFLGLIGLVEYPRALNVLECTRHQRQLKRNYYYYLPTLLMVIVFKLRRYRMFRIPSAYEEKVIES